MAARFAYRRPDAVHGLALWASYPARSDDLSDQKLAVASIYGTQDGLASEDEIAASRALLPPDTRWVAIQGGNHAQFGWYGPQRGDKAPTISRDSQQDFIVETMLDLLNHVNQPLP
jgi:pimeloyl-ACP methyl ester carboxylesterase